MRVGGRDFRLPNTVRRGAQRQLRSQQSLYRSINPVSVRVTLILISDLRTYFRNTYLVVVF